MFVASLAIYLRSDHMSPPEIIDNKLNTTARMMTAGIAGDALITITALVIGILGALSIIPGIPKGAAYALIGLGGVILLSWAGIGYATNWSATDEAKNMLRHAVCGSEVDRDL